MEAKLQAVTSESLILVHQERPSFISEMMKVSDFRTIYNLFCSVMILVFLTIVVENYIDTGGLLDPTFLLWVFSDIPYATLLWSLCFVVSLSVVPIQKAVAKGTISTTIGFLVYLVILVSLHFVIATASIHRGFPPGAGFMVMCELVRFSMKMHAYMMGNFTLRRLKLAKVDFTKNAPDAQKRLTKNKKKTSAGASPKSSPTPSPTPKSTPKQTVAPVVMKEEGGYGHTRQEEINAYPANLTLENYLYFLFAPTLIYQTSYPRTDRIRWLNVITSFIEVGLCVLSIYLIFKRHILPVVPGTYGDYPNLIKACFQLMSPAIMTNLLAFYGLLHCWMNAWAELLRFADRQFYRDWWNSLNFSTYYRKWNVVVHLFLHRHIFVESMERFGWSKDVSLLATFLISAVFHEYIIAVAFGFYKPVLMALFTLPGVFFIYLTQGFKQGQQWNIFMWIMLFMGHGIMVGLYARAWHFKRHLPPEEFTWTDLFNII